MDLFKGQWANSIDTRKPVQCNTCKETKNASEYHKDASSRSGIVLTCKPCRRFITQKWQLDNPALDAKRRDREYLKRKERGHLTKKAHLELQEQIRATTLALYESEGLTCV